MAADKKTKKAQKSNKPLCKLVKGDILKESSKGYRELVLNPQYLCRKCGRLAAGKKNLCKPESL